MRKVVLGRCAVVGVALVVGACRSPARPTPGPARPAPAPDVVPQTSEVSVTADASLAATPAPVASLRVGINGTRAGPRALSCRGYALAYSMEAAHPFADREDLPDLWWRLGGGEGNRVDLDSTQPVEFRRATVRWYLTPASSLEECRAVVELEAGGRVVATFEPGPECARRGAGETLVLETARTWSTPVRASQLRLLDRTRAFRDAPEREGYAMVQGLTLGESPDPPRPIIVTRFGDLHHGPSEGEGPGGYRFRVEGRGIFVVAPSAPPRRLRGVGARALDRAQDVELFELPGTSRAFLAATSRGGTQGALSRELYLADAAAPEGGLTRVHTFPSPMEDLWYDRCENALRVTTEDGRRWRVEQTGGVQEDPMGVDAGRP
ncbi:MAG: hypothetical protein HY909_29010 [Deltaproteobacteria bacterium]|nr:hypothetical protein [Deltaproteobacteria bacterium]